MNAPRSSGVTHHSDLTSSFLTHSRRERWKESEEPEDPCHWRTADHRTADSSSCSPVHCLSRIIFPSVLLFLFAASAVNFLSAELAKGRESDCSIETSFASDDSPSSLSLTIFSAAQPFTGRPGDPQMRALRSWLSLDLRLKVVLLGNHPSFLLVAKKFPGQVSVEPQIDCTFRGIPLVHSMLAKARAAKTSLVMVVPPDAILLPSLVEGLKAAHRMFRDFVLVGSLWSVPNLPPEATSRPSAIERRLASLRLAMVPQDGLWDHVRKTGEAQSSAPQIFLWTNPQQPLVHRAVPPFIYGRGAYEDWLLQAVLSENRTKVVDASSLVLGAVVAPGPAAEANESSIPGRPFHLRLWNGPEVYPWEQQINRHLASGEVGSTNAMLATAPVQLAFCDKSVEDATGSICLELGSGPIECLCEDASESLSGQQDARALEQRGRASAVCCSRERAPVPGPWARAASPAEAAAAPAPRPPGLPELLPLVALRGNNVILVSASHGYADALMSFSCRLRQLRIQNVIVAAMDRDIYEFALTHGLAVFLQQAEASQDSLEGSCEYGSNCFKAATHGKTKAVLEILTLGYSVIFSDLDIVWFQNPLPDLLWYGPHVLPVQSEVAEHDEASNSGTPINSGFYYARASDQIKRAFEKINEVSTSEHSQQHWFNEILCHGGDSRIGDHQCKWEGVTVEFLNRDKYPNGGYLKLWEQKNVTEACEERGCIILHNNFILKYEWKLERVKRHNFWYYEEETHLCTGIPL